MQNVINLFLNKDCVIDQRLIETCDHHRILSRAYPLLKDRKETIEPAVWKELTIRMQQHTRTALTQLHALTNIAKEFNQANIPLIAFKGIMLSYLLYDDYITRQCKDIDILIHKDDFGKAHKILTKLSYNRISVTYADKVLNTSQEEYFLQTYKDWGYIHSTSGLNIEMHRRLMPVFVKHININIDAIWNEAVPHSFFTTTIYSFSLEHLFLYLCAHGAISQWARFHWILDLWDFLKRYQSALDWNIINETSRKWHTTRCVSQGLLLINRLFNYPLPKEINIHVKNDWSVRKLNKIIVKTLLTPAEEFSSFKHNFYFALLFEPISSKIYFLWEKIKYRIQMRIRSLDRPWIKLFQNLLCLPGKKP